MTRVPLFAILMSAIILSSCATQEEKQENYSQKIQKKYRPRVRVMLYDAEKRPPTDKVDLYDGMKPITRQVEEVALMTCDAYAFEETDIVQVFRWKAGQLGADAVVMVTSANYQRNDPMIITSQGGFGGGGKGRTVFRAKAIRYADQK